MIIFSSWEVYPLNEQKNLNSVQVPNSTIFEGEQSHDIRQFSEHPLTTIQRPSLFIESSNFYFLGLSQIPGQDSPRLSKKVQPPTVHPISLQLIPDLSRWAVPRFSNGARARSGARSLPSTIPDRWKNCLRRSYRHFDDVSFWRHFNNNFCRHLNNLSDVLTQ